MPVDPHLEPEETCVYPGCSNRRKQGRSLCYRHAREADEAAEQLADEERQRGWPPTQMEGGDA